MLPPLLLLLVMVVVVMVVMMIAIAMMMIFAAACCASSSATAPSTATDRALALALPAPCCAFRPHMNRGWGGGVVFGSARAALPRVCLKWRRVKLSLQAACVSRKLRMARARCAVVACSF